MTAMVIFLFKGLHCITTESKLYVNFIFNINMLYFRLNARSLQVDVLQKINEKADMIFILDKENTFSVWNPPCANRPKLRITVKCKETGKSLIYP